jgi:DNA-binding response OmpR family regulator
MTCVLIIEDEQFLSNLIAKHLAEEGFDAIQAFDGENGLAMVVHHNPDVIILDIMLPKMDGLEVCRRIRQDRIVPILMLTAKSEEIDKVVGLEIGADDYLTKPFSVRELMARIKAILRRVAYMKKASKVGAASVIDRDGIYVDMSSHEVLVAGRRVDLTPKEIQVLHLLIGNPGRVFSREYLLDRIWGNEYDGFDRAVDNCILRLRNKLGRDNSVAARISTVWGVGYKYEKGEG